jgi:glycosyltransferase involved in cell wall biosynthesis
MTPVTIAVPAFKRLQYLPATLAAVDRQDYRELELIVSDNGENGPGLQELVRRYVTRPFIFRRNPRTVPITVHYNQLVSAASGAYFVLLCDDDEISPNFISDLAARLDANPRAAIAIPRQEIIDGAGTILRRSVADVPPALAAEEFITAWCDGRYRFECFATNMARTELIRACGGYPRFARGTHCDDALLIKLAIGREVVLSGQSIFRWRKDDRSHGFTISIEDLAVDSRQFLHFLGSDAWLHAAARRDPAAWARARRELVRMTFKTYYWRWSTLYRERLPRRRWARAAFAVPFNYRYYRRVLHVLAAEVKLWVAGRVRTVFRGWPGRRAGPGSSRWRPGEPK